MIIKCSRCGFINKDDVNFCVHCGNKLKEDSDTSQNNSNQGNDTSNNSQNNSNQGNDNFNAPQDELGWLLQKIYNSEINLPNCGCPVILKRGEEPVLVMPNITFREPHAVRTSVAGYGGPTFRIAKGVSFRLGGASSRSVSHDEIQKIDTGTLTITNKRLIFTGSMKTLNYNLSKILSITEFKDAVGIQRDNKQKTEYFTDCDRSILNYTINNQTKSTPFYGPLLKAVIMSQIQ